MNYLAAWRRVGGPPPTGVPVDTAGARGKGGDAGNRGAADSRRADQLRRLAAALSDALAVALDGQRWFDPVLEVVRESIDPSCAADRLERAIELLRATQGQQHRASSTRMRALQVLERDLDQSMQTLDGVRGAGSRFGQSLGAHRRTLEASRASDALRAVIDAVLDDTSRMQQQVEAACRTVAAAHERARAMQAEVGALEIRLAEASNQLSLDPLTGALNRRGFEQRFARMAADAREGRGFVVAMLDVDDFKAINDTNGHIAGDAVLRHVAQLAAAVLRDRDVLVRYGGEEFALLLPNATTDGASATIEQLRAQLADNPARFDEREIPVRFSAGLTAWRAGDSQKTMLERADEALYRAKRAGKNCARVG